MPKAPIAEGRLTNAPLGAGVSGNGGLGSSAKDGGIMTASMTCTIPVFVRISTMAVRSMSETEIASPVMNAWKVGGRSESR